MSAYSPHVGETREAILELLLSDYSQAHSMVPQDSRDNAKVIAMLSAHDGLHKMVVEWGNDTGNPMAFQESREKLARLKHLHRMLMATYGPQAG